MPVEVLNDKGPKRTLKFVRNTCYEGTDYGPGLPAGDTAEVDSHWAPIFIGNGRAVEEVSATGGPSTTEVQTRDPEPTHRDPELPEATKKKQ